MATVFLGVIKFCFGGFKHCIVSRISREFLNEICRRKEAFKKRIAVVMRKLAFGCGGVRIYQGNSAGTFFLQREICPTTLYPSRYKLFFDGYFFYNPLEKLAVILNFGMKICNRGMCS
ncbi:MAG: hypothetical protein WCU80_10530 [Paludibacteraceae bacterium]